MPQSFRDPTCVNYFQCLTLAAHANKKLCCTDCSRYKESEREEVLYLVPYAKLLYALFFSDKASRGNTAPKARDGLSLGSYVKVKDRV